MCGNGASPSGRGEAAISEPGCNLGSFMWVSCLPMLGALRRLCHLVDHLVEAEARRLLSRREFLEGAEELADRSLRRHEQIDAAEHPVVVGIRRNLRVLVRVRP